MITLTDDFQFVIYININQLLKAAFTVVVKTNTEKSLVATCFKESSFQRIY